MDCLVDSGLPKRVLKFRFTTVTQFVLVNSTTQNDFSTSLVPSYKAEASFSGYNFSLKNTTQSTSRVGTFQLQKLYRIP